MTTTEIIALLQKIPATFWGVVFGSFISILSVWLTNRASTTRLFHQFEHERLVKASERELAIKKDIYLDAAEAVSAGLSSLANLANLDIPDDKVMEQYTQKAPSLAKVQVVGSMETVDAFLALTGEHSGQMLKLWAIRHQLMAQKRQISSLDVQVSEFRKEADRFLEMIKQYNINGIADQNRWGVLQRNFDFEHKRSVETNQKRQDIAHQLAIKQIAFIQQCSLATISVSTFVIPVLTAVRKELELPLQLEGYRASVEKSLARQRETLEEYLGEISTAIDPVKPDARQLA